MKKWIVGVDEVGRGPLAGPVTVCAIAMPRASYRARRWKGLTDSKQMTAAAREVWEARARAMERQGGIRIALASRAAAGIDRRGISACITSCIESVLRRLGVAPGSCEVLLDGGLKAPARYKAQRAIIRGDSSQQIISLASVVAKVRRDALMRRLAKAHPAYGFDIHKGYGTAAHRAAMRRHGLCDIHRKTFCGKAF